MDGVIFPATEFHGRTLAERSIAGMGLVERSYPPSFRTPRHAHEQGYLCLILSGTSYQTSGSRSRIRTPSTVFFYPPHEIQSEQFGATGGCIFALQFRSHARWDDTDFSSIRNDESVDFKNRRLSWLMFRLRTEFYKTDQAASLAMEGLALEALAEISRSFANRKPTGRPGWLRQVMEILHERFADDSSMPEIAAAVGVHPVHLATSFRKHYGVTVGQYRRELRIEHAREMLTGSNRPIVEIALAAGFSSQAHFSRSFKQITGLTPAQCRSTCGHP